MVAVNQIVDERVFRYRTEGVDDVRAKADALAKSQGALAKSGDATAASNDRVEKSARGTADAYGRAGVSAAEAAQKQAVLERAQRQIQASMMQAAAGVDAYDRSLSGMADAQMRLAQAAAQASSQTVKAANDNATALGREGEAFRTAGKFALEHPVLVLAGSVAAARGLSSLSATAATSLGSASVNAARFAAATAEMGGTAAASAALAARGLGVASAAASTAAGGFAAYAESVAGMTTTTGLLARGLAFIPPAIVPIAGAFAAFIVGALAIEKANADLEKLVSIGRQAEALDVSAPFLKSFTGLGAKIEVEVAQMQAALQRASNFVRDRYGQADAATRAFGDLDTGTTPLRAAQQLALAQSTDERIRSVLAGMVELEERGQRLAALNVGEKVFGADLVERLRRGEGSIAQFVADLEQARGKEVMSQADVTRALELSRQIADVKREIGEATASTFDFSGAALRLREPWLAVLGVVRDVAKSVADSTSGGDAATLRQIQGLQARAQGIETVSIPRAVDRGDAAVVASLREQLEGLRGEADRLSSTMSSAAEKIDSDVGRIPPPLRLVSDEMERLTAAAEAAKSSVPGLAGALDGVAGAAANAAGKIASVAAGIRALQGLNPDLSGALGYLDKVGQVKNVYDQTLKQIEADFQKGGDEAAKAKATSTALDEQTRSLKALAEQRDKPLTSVVREGELSQMGDLDRSLAQISDRFSILRKEREDLARVTIDKAATPEDAAAIRRQFDAQIAKLDGAQKSLEAKARADAAARTANRGGGDTAGADAYDSAIQRAKDQIEELELQARTAGKTTEEVYRLTEANRLRRAADSAGRSDEQGIAEDIEKTAAALAKQRVATDQALEGQRRLQEGMRELGQDLTRFIDDALLGTGKLEDAFKSLAKTFSSSVLNALVAGQGPLAGLFNTANPERGQVGGLLGGQFNLGSLFNTRELERAVSGGAEDGILSAFRPLLQPRTNSAGVSQGFASSPLGSGLLSVGAGAAIGYQSQNPFIGAAGGALAGLATGNPIAAVAGGISGFIAGIFGDNAARRQRQRQIQEQLDQYAQQYAQELPQINNLRAGFRGEATSGNEVTIQAAFQQMLQANLTASRGGDQVAADQMVHEFEAYRLRLREIFSQAFAGTVEEVRAGLGTNGPFAQAAAAVVALGETLKAFVADTSAARGVASGEQARQAAVQGALATLDAPKTLSATQTEIARIQGTAEGLRTVLVQLGVSANDVSQVIFDRVNGAFRALQETFNSDVGRKLNDATGRGYLNDAQDLVKEIAGLRTDALAIGGDMAQVQAYYLAAAQKLVNENELTGDAFTALAAVFPDLTTQLHAFTGAVDDAANTAAIAARKLAFQDRLFAATNDTSTLEGQLAAYDRQAQREREEEIKAGGEAIADLEAAQYAERLKIIVDFQQQAADAEKQRMEAAQQAFDTFARNIKTFVDGLRAGSGSPLSPQARLAAAQSQYNAQLSLAQGGNRDALDGITSYASDLLDAAKGFYASSSAFQAVFQQVTGQLTALPTQVSPEQFIVNAINDSKAATIAATQAMQAALKTAIDAGSATATATALLPQFNTLTATTGGLLNYSQFVAATGGLATTAEQQAARSIFSRIDTNGDGVLSRLELGNASTGRVEQYTNATRNSTDTSNGILNSTNGILNSINVFNSQVAVYTNATQANVNTGNQVLAQIKALNDNISNQNNFVKSNTDYLNQLMATEINTLANSYNIQVRMVNNLVAANIKAGATYYARGGLVTGPGTGTSDSIATMLSNGEFVLTAEATRRLGVSRLDAMNDNRMGMPAVAMPVPVAMGAGGMDSASATEIRALRAELKAALDMLARVTVAGAEHVGERVDGVKDAVDEARRAELLAA